jgi:hypothetical protein
MVNRFRPYTEEFGNRCGYLGAGSVQERLDYRGYDLELGRTSSTWRVGIYPRHPELPILRRAEVYSENQDDAVIEAKFRIDVALRL